MHLARVHVRLDASGVHYSGFMIRVQVVVFEVSQMVYDMMVILLYIYSATHDTLTQCTQYTESYIAARDSVNIYIFKRFAF